MPLVRKGPGCAGCPLQAFGDFMVPDRLVEGAPVLVYGQNPGADEEAQGRPFVGKTGQLMDSCYLPLAGLRRPAISCGNAIRCRVKGTNDLPELSSTVAREALAHCTRAYHEVPPGTRLIVAQGAYALHALTGEGLGQGRTVNSWRGYMLSYAPCHESHHSPPMGIWAPSGPSDLPVFATLHLAGLYNDPTLKLPTQADWHKVRSILAHEWPAPLPPIRTSPVEVLAPLSAFDTEFTIDTGALLRYSYFDGADLHVVERDMMSVIQVPAGRCTVVMQNAPADLDYFEALLDPEGVSRVSYEDTSYMHSVLWTDMPHGLDFLGSLYGRTNRWKHLFKANELEYSAGDAVGTLDVFSALRKALAADPDSRWVYEECVRPQIEVIAEATREGLRVDQVKAQEFLRELSGRRREAELMATAAVGWPVNVGSPTQLAYELYKVQGLKAPRKGRR